MNIWWSHIFSSEINKSPPNGSVATAIKSGTGSLQPDLGREGKKTTNKKREERNKTTNRGEKGKRKERKKKTEFQAMHEEGEKVRGKLSGSL